MGRYRFTAYENDARPRYIVVWGLQWQIIDCRRLEPCSDVHVAMTEAIEQLPGEGWQAEGNADYGFVFIQRAGDRRLLMLTERDPADSARQSFSPFSK